MAKNQAGGKPGESVATQKPEGSPGNQATNPPAAGSEPGTGGEYQPREGDGGEERMEGEPSAADIAAQAERERDRVNNPKARDYEKTVNVPTREGGRKPADARLTTMISNAPPLQRFIALMLAAALGEEGTGAVLDEIAPKMGNFSREVAGHTLIHFLGKSKEQILRDFEGDERKAEQVFAALDEEGRPALYEAELRRQNTKNDSEIRESDPQQVRRLASPMTGEGRQDRPTTQGGDTNREPTFGGYRLSEVAGVPDEELLKRPGMNRRLIADIRQAEAGRR